MALTPLDSHEQYHRTFKTLVIEKTSKTMLLKGFISK